MTQAAEQPKELTAFIESENEKLRAAGAESAEKAFGIGCGLGLIPAVVIAVVLYAFSVVNFILAMVLLSMGLLAVVGISMLLASRARINAERRSYQDTVKPEIIQYLTEVEFTPQQFSEIVDQQLPVAAPLRAHLDKTGIG